MSTIVTPDDLSTYLDTTVNPDRAQMLINHAITQALAIVTVGTVPDSGPTEENLPVGAESVLLPAVARIYLNPAGVTSEAAVGFTYSRTAGTGSMYSKAERATLRRIAGQAAGAFTVDPTPSTAMEFYTDPLAQTTSQELLEYAEEAGFTQ